MVWKEHDYDDIEGTYVFNGESAHSAFGLNKLLFSFNHEHNRKAYADDPAAYADQFLMTDAQREALLSEDFLEMIRLGANIYYLAKLAVPKGFSMQDAGAAFQKITTPEFQSKLDAKADGLTEKLNRIGGFWNG